MVYARTAHRRFCAQHPELGIYKDDSDIPSALRYQRDELKENVIANYSALLDWPAIADAPPHLVNAVSLQTLEHDADPGVLRLLQGSAGRRQDTV